MAKPNDPGYPGRRLDSEWAYVRNLSEQDYRAWVAEQLVKIQRKQESANGRLNGLDRHRYMAIGALTTVFVLVVPIFVDLVLRS